MNAARCSRVGGCASTCRLSVCNGSRPLPRLSAPRASVPVSTSCSGLHKREQLRPRQVTHKAVAGSDAYYTDKPIPNVFWRAFAALIYVIPCIDSFTLGLNVYPIVPQLLVLNHVGGVFAPYYWSSQFTGLIVFFLVFLAVIKNKKLHHFIRFNAMQAMMLDILVMLPTVAQAYVPSEIAWTVVGRYLQGFCFISMATCLIFAFITTLAGKYADIPYISEAVYIQVHQTDLM